MEYQLPEPRKIICSRCSREETERTFGSGFMGWQTIREVVGKIITMEQRVGINKVIKLEPVEKFVNPELCPECMKELVDWINKKRE